jgi:hypothetical protein
MEPVLNASEAGPSAYATYREASLTQRLERYMAEANALSAERMSGPNLRGPFPKFLENRVNYTVLTLFCVHKTSKRELLSDTTSHLS